MVSFFGTDKAFLPPLILAGVYAAYGLLATPPRNLPQELPARNAAALRGGEGDAERGAGQGGAAHQEHVLEERAGAGWR